MSSFGDWLIDPADDRDRSSRAGEIAPLKVRFGLVTQVDPPLVLLDRDSAPSAMNVSCVALDAAEANATRVVVLNNGGQLILLARVAWSAS